jgi:hypothetical protein
MDELPGAGLLDTHARDLEMMTVSGSLRTCLLAAMALLLSGATAHADPGAAAAALDESAVRYFEGEKAQGPAWQAAGDASLVAGGTLLAQRNDILRGMSYPLHAVGVIQFVAGFSSLTRTDGRLAALRREIASAPAAIHARETKRIDRLSLLFRVIKYTEFSLLGVGVAGMIAGGAARQDQILGAGIGLAVEAAAMLTLDHFAEERAHRYAHALHAISFAVAPTDHGTTLSLSFTGRF